MISKKKKVFAKIQSDFSAEIQNSNVFFRPKLGDLQKKKKKKKKGLRQNSRRFFTQFRKFKRLRGGSFRMGGAIFHFSQKIGLKSTKNMLFCILHKPMGGARAPPAPPLATLLLTSHVAVHLLQSTIVSNFFYYMECIHHTFAILPTSHNF